MLLPAELATALAAMRGEPQDRVFAITERRINYIVKAAAKRAGINPATSAHWLRHAPCFELDDFICGESSGWSGAPLRHSEDANNCLLT